jgi:cyanophycinase
MRPGPLALVGGDELNPGNEPQDRVLAAAAGDGPAYVLATAAAKHRPDLAVANARRWFAPLGLDVQELPVLSRRQANDPAIATDAATGRFFYLVGGDPGHTAQVLVGTKVWESIVGAWRAGAALGGSSAGAMALGEWTLIRGRFPGDDHRAYRPALGLVPGVAVLPHFETFGHRWLPSALADAPRDDVVLLGLDERTAAVWTDGAWRAMGPGAVTVVRGGERIRAEAAPIEGVPDPGSTVEPMSGEDV